MSIRRLSRRAIASLAILAGGCIVESPVTPSAQVLVVQAVLDPMTDTQYVLVQQSLGTTTTTTSVSGATVTLALPSGASLAATEEPDTVCGCVARISSQPPIGSVYLFALKRAGVALVPGGTYGLRVTLPDGRVVTGATTIPSAVPDTSSPPMSFDPSRDTLRLAWRRVPGARSYELRVHASKSDYATFTDTSIALPGNARNSDDNPIFSGIGAFSIAVTAVDSNYYNYYRRNSDPFSGVGIPSNLAGATGVFGSLVQVAGGKLLVSAPAGAIRAAAPAADSRAAATPGSRSRPTAGARSPAGLR